MVGAVGCKDKCERAADTLAEKCGGGNEAEGEESGESCEADSEILAECINDNEGKTCAEIVEACLTP